MVARHATALINKGFLQVPYPSPIRNQVLRTATSWKNFCSLTPMQKNAFPLGYQYLPKEGSEVFEITLPSRSMLLEACERTGDDIITDFTGNTFALLQDIEKLVLEFSELMEKHFDLPHFSDEVAKNRDHWTLRLTHHGKGQSMSAIQCEAHQDSTVFALYLHQTIPGVQYQNEDMRWENLPMNDDSVIIIPSPQLALRSEGKVMPLNHRIVNNPATAAIGRFSMVLFVNMASKS